MRGATLLLVGILGLVLIGCKGEDTGNAASVGTAKPAPIASKPGAQMAGVEEGVNPAGVAPTPGGALGKH